MKKVTVITVLLVAAILVFAQNDSLKLLMGGWYFYEPVKTEVNDTIKLSRTKSLAVYTKWEFRENGSFAAWDVEELSQEGAEGEKGLIMKSMEVSTWNYNKEEMTIGLRDLSRRYRIISNNPDWMVLVRLE